MATPPLRVLIVNDETEGLQLWEHALTSEFSAVDVTPCRSADEALARLGREKFDAVITDNRMPTMTGIDLVQAIRSTDRCLPVLMLTGCPDREQEARAAGVTSFISGGNWALIRREIRHVLAAAVAAGARPPDRPGRA